MKFDYKGKICWKCKFFISTMALRQRSYTCARFHLCKCSYFYRITKNLLILERLLIHSTLQIYDHILHSYFLRLNVRGFFLHTYFVKHLSLTYYLVTYCKSLFLVTFLYIILFLAWYIASRNILEHDLFNQHYMPTIPFIFFESKFLEVRTLFNLAGT